MDFLLRELLLIRASNANWLNRFRQKPIYFNPNRDSYVRWSDSGNKPIRIEENRVMFYGRFAARLFTTKHFAELIPLF